MKKATYIFTILALMSITLTKANNDKIFEYFSEKYGNSEIKQDTLLIVEYKTLDINDPMFTQTNIGKDILAEFIANENKNIKSYNENLKKIFKKYYDYPYKIVQEEDLINFPASQYPYVYKRYINTKNGKELYYTRFFMSREEKVSYEDINLNSDRFRARLLIEKDIVLALNDFLME